MQPLQTQQEQPVQNNTPLYLMIGAVVILLIYIGYLYGTKSIIDKKEFSKNYVLKEDITFDTLPYEIQNRYILESLSNHKITLVENENHSLRKKLQEAQSSQTIEIAKKTTPEKQIAPPAIKEVEVEKIEKIVVTMDETQDKTKVPEKLKSVATYTCKTLKSSSEFISKKCKNELISFLDTHKDGKKFEIIGLIDDQEFVLIQKLEDVYGKARVGNLSKYAQNGLSKHRAVEALWVARQHLGKDAPLATTSYSLTEKNKRGFVVKVYK